MKPLTMLLLIVAVLFALSSAYLLFICPGKILLYEINPQPIRMVYEASDYLKHNWLLVPVVLGFLGLGIFLSSLHRPR